MRHGQEDGDDKMAVGQVANCVLTRTKKTFLMPIVMLKGAEKANVPGQRRENGKDDLGQA